MSAELPVCLPRRSWLRSLADAPQLGALSFGALLFAVGLAAFALWELGLGRFDAAGLPGDPQDVFGNARVAVTHIVCAAYLMAAFVHALRMGEESLRRVGPLLGREPDVERLLDTSGESRVLLVAGLVGVGAWLLATLVSPGTVRIDPRGWTAEVAWHRVLGLAMGVLVFRLSALLVIQSSRLSRLATHIRQLDLLDLSDLRVFTRHGLGNALLILGFAAAFSLFLLSPGYLAMAGGAWILAAGVAAAGLLLPLVGARRRIQEAKAAELAWCRARLRDARSAMEDGSSSPTRVDELLAWEARIDAVREWPLDTTAVARFALYLLIPLGSWSAAALVERWIDNLLG